VTSSGPPGPGWSGALQPDGSRTGLAVGPEPARLLAGPVGQRALASGESRRNQVRRRSAGKRPERQCRIPRRRGPTRARRATHGRPPGPSCTLAGVSGAPGVGRSADASPGSGARDLVTALLCTWLIAGVFLDAWAHNTRPALESFFTPWHAVLYSGFLATGAWILAVRWRGRGAGGGRPAGGPAGYGLAAAGVALFALAGLGDMLWHVAFGIERDLAALLSPTHLGLFVAMLLIVTAPVRAAWPQPGAAPASWRGLLPVALSLALTGTLLAAILQPFHPLAHNFASRRLAALILERSAGSWFVMARNVQAGLAGFMLATVCLFGPVLLLVCRWRPPPGMITAMLAFQSVLVQASSGFREPSLAALGAAGALAADALARGIRPWRPGRGRLLAFAGVAPPLFWGLYLAGIAVRDGGLGWRTEVWSGTLVWTGLVLLGVALALSADARRAPAAS
jgi:hypothetical protein